MDSGGSLRFGPRSAGADPGPVCYGKGVELTVTIANLLLRRLAYGRERFLSGRESARGNGKLEMFKIAVQINRNQIPQDAEAAIGAEVKTC